MLGAAGKTAPRRRLRSMARQLDYQRQAQGASDVASRRRRRTSRSSATPSPGWPRRSAWTTPGIADLKTVVTEACMNVVVHAYQGEPGPLNVEAEPDADGLTVVVRDPGVGIRPQADVEPRQPAPRPLADRGPLQQLRDLRRPRPRHRGRRCACPCRAAAPSSGDGEPVEIGAATGERTELVADRAGAARPGAGARRRRPRRAPRPLGRPRLRRGPASPTRSPPRRPRRFADGRVRLGLDDDEDGIELRLGPMDRRRRRADPRGARGPRRRRLARGARRRAQRSRSRATASTWRSASAAAPAPLAASSSICSRIRARARRRIRETCICEWPICSAICDCVMSSTKRSRSTSRSRSSRWGRAASRAIRPSTSSKLSSSLADPLRRGRFVGVVAARRPVERERPAVVVCLEHLEHVGLLQLEPLGDLADRGRALQLLGQLGDRLVDLAPCGRAGRAAPARSRRGRGSGV